MLFEAEEYKNKYKNWGVQEQSLLLCRHRNRQTKILGNTYKNSSKNSFKNEI